MRVHLVEEALSWYHNIAYQIRLTRYVPLSGNKALDPESEQHSPIAIWERPFMLPAVKVEICQNWELQRPSLPFPLDQKKKQIKERSFV